MSRPRIRPTFECPLPGDAQGFYRALDEAVREPGVTCRGMVFGTERKTGAILRRHETDQHFWSPALHLHVRDDEQPNVLGGKFSASSPVWTGFLAIYLALTCIGICSISYGGAQLMMDDEPWALWGIPIVVALAAFTYGAAFIGQGLGSEDMYELRRFVDDVVERTAHENPGPDATS